MFSRSISFKLSVVALVSALPATNTLAQVSTTPKPPLFSSKPVQSSPVFCYPFQSRLVAQYQPTSTQGTASDLLSKAP
jgi:hypothetical protein